MFTMRSTLCILALFCLGTFQAQAQPWNGETLISDDTSGTKRLSFTYGWFYDEHYPYVFWYKFNSWCWTAPGGDINGFWSYHWNSQDWIYMGRTFKGWYWSDDDRQWHHVDTDDDGGILYPWRGRADFILPLAQTLDQHLVVGYQGWFRTEGDPAGDGWVHYGGNRQTGPSPGNVTIDFWPDLSEAGEDEKYPTPFVHADGSIAMLYSSANYNTVDRHFRWMKEYGIDAAFMQRFGTSLSGDMRD